jgi:hypothetical protein
MSGNVDADASSPPSPGVADRGPRRDAESERRGRTGHSVSSTTAGVSALVPGGVAPISGRWRNRVLLSLALATSSCIGDCFLTPGSTCISTLDDCAGVDDVNLVCARVEPDDVDSDLICVPAVPLQQTSCGPDGDVELCHAAGFAIEAECGFDDNLCRCDALIDLVVCEDGSFDPVTCACP